MGNRAQGGWTLRRQKGSPFFYVRFRHAGRRHEKSTGETDRAAARLKAGQIYAETVSGRLTPAVVAGQSLASVTALWLLDYRAAHAAGTADTAEQYVGAHWLPFFGELGRITTASIADYARARIQVVQRGTVRKELSALRQFVDWAHQGGYLRELPEVASMPTTGHVGVRHARARKRVATVLTPAELKRFFAALPLRSRRHGAWVRPLFVVLYETGLRPSSLYRLEVPTHYQRGARELFLSRETDKTGQKAERTVPLTAAARRELDRVVGTRTKGLLFEKHRWQEAIAKACREAKIAKAVSVYDMRHTRLTHLANTAGVPLTGVQYLAGHKHLSTTAKYVQAQREAADVALKVFGRG